MPRFFKRYLLWFFYAAFLIVAIMYGSREPIYISSGEYSMGKTIVLAIYICFLIYSLYATKQENFFKTLGIVNKLYWGRQIGIDLYISVFLSLGLIYLVEGSAVVLLLWFVPIFVFANLAILPYILLNYGAIVGKFVQ